MDVLKTADLNTLGLWLSPDFMVPLARFHGNGDPILGANQAYKEVRGLIRSYAKYVRWRENKRGEKDIGLAQAMRALGYAGNFQRIVPLRDAPLFRKTAFSFWPMGVGAETPGEVEVEVGDASDKRVKAAALKTVCQMLKAIPSLNLAILDNRVWQRRSPEIMLNVVIEREVRSMVFSAASLTLKEINSFMFRGLRRLMEIENHPLRFMTNQLLECWAEYFWESKGTGYIASPAGAMVTFVPNSRKMVARGSAALVPFNGIPLVINVSFVGPEKVCFSCTPNHVAIDGDTIGAGYEFMHDRLQKILGEET
jgi:hypothetical protein